MKERKDEGGTRRREGINEKKEINVEGLDKGKKE